MELHQVLERVQALSDLELASLICLIAKQNCIIEADDDLVDDVTQELVLIVSEVFGLSYAILSEDQYETVDKFGDAILGGHGQFHASLDEFVHDSDHRPSGIQGHDGTIGSVGRHDDTKFDTRKTVNVVIAKNFNMAPEDVQVQAIELIRCRRIYSHTTVHPVPDVFMIIAVIPRSLRENNFMKHLNDQIFMSHYHDPEDGFPNLESIEEPDLLQENTGDDYSPLRHFLSPSSTKDSTADRKLGSQIINKLRVLGEAATVSPEVRQYMHNIVVFLRLERGVSGGVSPHATVLLESLSKYLAPLHGLTYVTPSLVVLAVKKIYPHRIQIATPEKERSMQYGSDLKAVCNFLEGLSPESIIETVLSAVECPL